MKASHTPYESGRTTIRYPVRLRPDPRILGRMVPKRTDEPVPIPSVGETPVYTADGHYFGDVVDLALDLETAQAEALLVGNVDTDRFGPLPDGAEGVRVPYRYVRSIGDIVVLNRPFAPDRDVEEMFGSDGAADADTRAPADDRTEGAPDVIK